MRVHILGGFPLGGYCCLFSGFRYLFNDTKLWSGTCVCGVVMYARPVPSVFGGLCVVGMVHIPGNAGVCSVQSMVGHASSYIWSPHAVRAATTVGGLPRVSRSNPSVFCWFNPEFKLHGITLLHFDGYSIRRHASLYNERHLHFGGHIPISGVGPP